MHGSKEVKAFTGGKRRVNTALAYRFKVLLARGTYRYRVLAVDLAGNVAKSIGSARRKELTRAMTPSPYGGLGRAWTDKPDPEDECRTKAKRSTS